MSVTPKQSKGGRTANGLSNKTSGETPVTCTSVLRKITYRSTGIPEFANVHIFLTKTTVPL